MSGDVKVTSTATMQRYGTRAMQYVTDACRNDVDMDEVRLVNVKHAIQVLQQLQARLEVQLEADLAIHAAKQCARRNT